MTYNGNEIDSYTVRVSFEHDSTWRQWVSTVANVYNTTFLDVCASLF